MKDPLNLKIDEGTMGSKDQVSVIGVVKNFHFQSFHEQIEPLVIFQLNPEKIYNAEYMLLKISGRDIPETIKAVENKWKEMTNDHLFEYTFLDRDFAHLFDRERVTTQVYSLFSIISILIASLGLLGLSMFFSKKKIKEIGVRKINGARVWQVLLLMNNTFIKKVVIAFAVASPVAWYVMHKWLENFAYKTELSWWIFGSAGACTLGIVLLTVSWQSWKAATRNPVDALRYE